MLRQITRNGCRTVLALASAAVLLAACPAVAAEDLDGYASALQAASAALKVEGAPAAAGIAAQLRAIDRVTLPDGTIIVVDNRDLLAALEAEPPDHTAAVAHLRALVASLDRARRPGEAARFTDAGSSLRRVLDRPEFRQTSPTNPITTFVSNLFRRFADWLDSLLFSRSSFGIGRESLALIGLVMVVSLVIWVSSQVRRTIGPSSYQTPAQPSRAVVSAAMLREDAVRLASAGSFRGAISTLYRALLLHLEEQGKLRFDRAMTNREVLAAAEVKGDAILVPRLAPLVMRFDRFWYGGSSGSAEDFTEFRRLVAQGWDAT